MKVPVGCAALQIGIQINRRSREGVKALPVIIRNNILSHQVADAIVSVHDGDEAVDAVMHADECIFPVTEVDNGMHDVIERVITNIFSHCLEHVVGPPFDGPEPHAIDHPSHWQSLHLLVPNTFHAKTIIIIIIILSISGQSCFTFHSHKDTSRF